MSRTYEVTYSVVVTIEADTPDQARKQAFDTLNDRLDGFYFMSHEDTEELPS